MKFMKNTDDFILFEGYKITQDSDLINQLNGVPSELAKQLKRLHNETIDKRNKGIIKKLSDLIVKYPNVALLKNYLTVAYILKDENEKGREAMEWTLSEHPDYLFGKYMKADLCVEDREFEKVKEILGESLELKELCPDRDWFHISELTGFFTTIIKYYIAIENFETAKNELERFRNLSPNHPHLDNLSDKLLYAEFKNDRSEWDDDDDDEIGIEVIANKQTPHNNVNELPNFYHPEISAVYNFGYDIPEKLLRELLALPKESLIADLELVIKDAIDRYDYFVESQDELATLFPLHAINMLAELKSNESLPVILDFLSYNNDFIDFWFGIDIEFILLNPIYLLGKNNIEILKEFLLTPNIDSYVKITISEVVTQMWVHKDKTMEEILDFYSSVLNGYLNADIEDNLIDSENICSIVSNCLDIGFSEMLPIIKQHFDKGYLYDMFGRNYKQIEADFSNPLKMVFEKEVLDIYQYYQRKKEEEDEKSEWDTDIFDDEYEGFDDEYDENNGENFTDFEIVKPKAKVIEMTSKPIAVNKVGRNDLCPCGSGKKYKKCCME